MSAAPPAVGVLLRGARLVDAAAGRSGEPMDVRLADGRVAEIGPSLTPAPGEEVVALDGRWVIPGLWDAHTHMSQWALSRRRLDVSGATSAADAARLVAERLRTDPPPAGLPLVGFGFRDGLWGDEPTAALLDAAAGAGAPSAAGCVAPSAVVLVSGDLHCGWLSTLAAQRFGVASGGLLREHPWFAVLDLLGEAPAGVLDLWVAEAVTAAAARGVVGVVDFERSPAIESWARRTAGGHRDLRVVTGVWPEHLAELVDLGLRTGDPVPGTGTDGLVRMGPLKVVSDGALNTRTARCHDPYPGPGGAGDPRGVLSVGPEELSALLAAATAAGLDCAVHAIGDLANTVTLDAFAATGARGSVEHAQLLLPGDVARLAALGLTASVQPEHAMDDRDVADRYWAGRTDRAFPLRSLHEAGVRLAFGSDAPVAPLDPWLGVSAAVDRARDGREPWHPEQRLPLGVALAASARGRTRVQVGDVADLAVLDADPWQVESLRTMPVAGTLLAGRWTHRTTGTGKELR